MLTVQLACEERHIPPEEVYRPMIIPQVIAGLAQVEMRCNLEVDIPESCGDGQGTLACGNGAFIVRSGAEMAGHIGGDPPQPTLIAQRLGESLGLAQMCEER